MLTRRYLNPEGPSLKGSSDWERGLASLLTGITGQIYKKLIISVSYVVFGIQCVCFKIPFECAHLPNLTLSGRLWHKQLYHHSTLLVCCYGNGYHFM